MTRFVAKRIAALAGGAALVLTLASCGDSGGGGGPSTDSGSHWLRPCENETDCGGLACVCGLCTSGCGDDTGCLTLDGVCVAPSGVSGADCEAGESPLGLCTAECDAAGECPGTGDEFVCEAGYCVAEINVLPGPCEAEGACGPAPGMPNVQCADGTMGGPTGRCLETTSGACGWEIRECPPPAGDPVTCESCPGPAPGMPNTLCSDGETVGGPACLADETGNCGWVIVECP